MSNYRTDEDVRNFDVFKAVVLALLLVTLFLAVMLGRSSEGDATATGSGDETTGEVVDQGAVGEDEIAEAPEPAEITAPDLLSPAPESELEAGPQTFSGMGTPGSEVVITADGTEVGRATVDENGTWELDADIPQGVESVQLQAVDSDGNVVASSEEIPMTAVSAEEGEEAAQEGSEQDEAAAEDDAQDEAASDEAASDDAESEETAQDEESAQDDASSEPPTVDQPESPVPEFNPLTGSVALAGASAAGAQIAAIVDEQVIDSATADSEGNWQLNLDMEPGTYDLAFGQMDEDGNVTSRSEAVAIQVPGQLPQLDLPDYSLPDETLAAIAGAEAADETGAETEEGTAETTSEDTAVESEEGAAAADAFTENVLDSLALPAIKMPAGPIEWTGSAEPGSDVAVVVDGEIAGTTTADEDGRFTLAGDLAAGVSSLQLGIFGEDGALSAKSKEITVAVADMELPTVQLPELTGDEATVPVSGSAAPGTTVEITADGETVGETTAAADGSWAIALAPFAEAVAIRVQAIGEDGLPILQSSPVQLPGSAEAVAEAPAEGEAETPAEGEAEAPAEGEAEAPAEGEAEAPAEGEAETPAEGEAETPAEGEAETPAEGEAAADVTGSVTYQERIALPDDAIVKVQIQDVSRADGMAVVMGEQIIEAGGLQVPIPYEVPYDAAEINEAARYSMRARIEDSDGTLLFTNDSAIPVITNGNPTADVEIQTVPVGSAASDAELGQAEVDFDSQSDSVVEAAETSGSFSILLDGLQAAGLTQTLSEVEGAYTLFAPTDEAFEALPPGIVAGWNANPEEYAAILRNLVVEGKYAPQELTDGLVLRSVDETNIGITRDEEQLSINGVPVVDASEAGDSVVYALPQVILPPLPAGISAPIIDQSGVPYFIGELLTVVGQAEPGQRIVLAVDDERFGDVATVDQNGFWLVSNDIGSGIHTIIALMIDDRGLVQAISNEIVLAVP